MNISRSEHRWRVTAGGDVLHDCLEYLAYQQGYRVASVSQALGITEQHFRRIFQRDVGVPAKEWMKWERMVVARRMLAREMDPLEISDALGFAHANSFRREFRETYEVTVSRFLELRARMRERGNPGCGNVC